MHPITEADRAAAKKYLRTKGCIDNSLITKADHEELAEYFADHRAAERLRIAEELRSDANEVAEKIAGQPARRVAVVIGQITAYRSIAESLTTPAQDEVQRDE